jgi:cytoskeleton protein RodZ
MTLRSARIQRGLSIEQVAQDTRISARFLEALEDEAFQELPAPVYVRGFLRSYGNYLRLDPLPLLEQLPPSLGGGSQAARAEDDAPTRDESVRRSADPFRPAAPARPPIIGEEEFRPVAAAADPFSPRRAETETPLDAPYESPYRRGRVGGVLVERGAVYEDNGRVVRFAALVGGGLVILVLFTLGAMALGGGGNGNGGQAQAGDDTPDPTGSTTAIVVGSVTPDGSATPDDSVTPAEGETPANTPEGETETPTPTAEAEPTSTPTAPPPTATPTPVPPTPTPTEPPPPPGGHGTAFSECPTTDNGQPQCGSPIKVVCPPGTWFVDYGNDFPVESSGYRWVIVGTNGEALTAGSNGCV